MVENCVFCKILRREARASCIFEDTRVSAFLDFKPISEGHTLVVFKKHYENIYEIPEEEAAHLFKVVKKVAWAVKKGVNAEGITIIQNNGRAAGQVVFHIHVHVIPRSGEQRSHQPRKMWKANRLDLVAKRIKQFF